jgi:plasmid stabilization system protein ParE
MVPRVAERIEARMRWALSLITRYPEAAQAMIERPDARRFPLARFPYVISYEIGPDGPIVLRILHGARRHPWQKQTQDGNEG